MHTVFSKLIQWSWNPVIVVDIFIPYFHYTYHLSFTYRKVGMIHYWARFRPGTHFLIPTGSPSHWSIHLWVSLSEGNMLGLMSNFTYQPDCYIPTRLLHTYQIVRTSSPCYIHEYHIGQTIQLYLYFRYIDIVYEWYNIYIN